MIFIWDLPTPSLRGGCRLSCFSHADADRVGVAVKENGGKYKLLNGNETGLLLTNYILSQKSIAGTLGAYPTVIKTIVSTDMAFSVAKKYGASVKEVLTGFKYIGELMDELDNFVIGFEESYGYLIGAHARDKDAVSASMMIAEMCAYYKSIGKSLSEVLTELYEEHGYYKTALVSVSYPGKAGMDEMNTLIKDIRTAPPTEIFGKAVDFTDYKNGVYGLPKSDVMRFKNEVFSVIIRPSGTEPKLKIYFSMKAENANEADSQIFALISEVKGSLLKN